MNVIDALRSGAKTIPELCKMFDENNEYKIMREIAELVHKDKAYLAGFETCYEPDGCAFYLAKYALKT